jgi:hypothetical protein
MLKAAGQETRHGASGIVDDDMKNSARIEQHSRSVCFDLHPEHPLPAGAFAGWDLHRLESAALSRRTPVADP